MLSLPMLENKQKLFHTGKPSTRYVISSLLLSDKEMDDEKETEKRFCWGSWPGLIRPLGRRIATELFKSSSAPMRESNSFEAGGDEECGRASTASASEEAV
jgi:hypothetical protein